MLSSIYLFGGWAIRLIMIPVVARHHRTFVALAWLAPIFLFPVAGTVLYLWLGRLGLQRSARKHREVRGRIETDDRLREQDRFQPDDVRPEHRDLVRLTERLFTRRLGGFPILDGNDVELLTEPGAMVDRLVADLAAAERTAHLLFYLYVDDRTGRRVAEALADAAARGVRCRVLVDGWMSRRMRRSLGRWLEARGVEVRPMLPMHPLRQPLTRIDIRNHRKIAVIDGRVGYTGSHNLHDPGHALEQGIWHQISVRVEGPAALQLQMLFVEDWHFATDQLLDGDDVFPTPRPAGGCTVQAIPEGPSYSANLFQHVFIQLLAEAQERAVITTPYFVPDEPCQLAVEMAALRGVRVDLVVPRHSDRWLADTAARAYFQDLLDAGVHVHRHPSGILHAKTVSVDEQLGLVGTANLDRRSLFLNYEVLLLVYKREFTGQLREAQLRFLEQSEPLDPDRWRRRPERSKVLENTVKLLSPVL